MSDLTRPPIEIIIACHTPERRIDRAVHSVLVDNAGIASVTVVCHNVAQDRIVSRIPEPLRGDVRFLELQDGISSPAGPFSYGLERAMADWVGIMGSDDFYEPGALAEMLKLAPGRDAVMPNLRHDNGSPVRTPPCRPFRPVRARRDAVKDRLYYRSAPLGLVRREFLEQRGLTLDAGLRVGEDLRMSTLLWSLANVSVQSRGPAYVVGADAVDRITLAPIPVAEEMRHVHVVWGDECLPLLTREQRNALATKYLRIHLFGAAYYRSLRGEWLRGDRGALADAAEKILSIVPRATAPLSRADRDLLDAILDLHADDEIVNRLAQQRRQFRRPAALMPRSLSHLFHREAPLRFMIASALVR